MRGADLRGEVSEPAVILAYPQVWPHTMECSVKDIWTEAGQINLGRRWRDAAVCEDGI